MVGRHHRRTRQHPRRRRRSSPRDDEGRSKRDGDHEQRRRKQRARGDDDERRRRLRRGRVGVRTRVHAAADHQQRGGERDAVHDRRGDAAVGGGADHNRHRRHDDSVRERAVGATLRVHRERSRGEDDQAAHSRPRDGVRHRQGARARGDASGRVRGGEAHELPEGRDQVHEQADRRARAQRAARKDVPGRVAVVRPRERSRGAAAVAEQE
mmetsp:Transcript_9489/g.34528  ORF Transcript_9489/g.34528 Transcript_9489/m.34528 type:complete len:211 (+) Transcript_9489:869-1501(+)